MGKGRATWSSDPFPLVTSRRASKSRLLPQFAPAEVSLLFPRAVTLSESDRRKEGDLERRFRSFSDLEKDTIGKLLPDNEEDLLAGIGQTADMDRASHSVQMDMDRTVHSTGSNGFEEREDFDLFSSGKNSRPFSATYLWLVRPWNLPSSLTSRLVRVWTLP
jgi:hypothetical protein